MHHTPPMATSKRSKCSAECGSLGVKVSDQPFEPSACDCDPRGILEQQCNKVSGQCVCVEGVSGLRCDICARGFSGTFPDCRRCHQCFIDWDGIVGQLTNQTHRLVNKVNAIKASGAGGPYTKSINSVERSIADIQAIVDHSPAAQPLGDIQHLLQQAR